MLTSNLPTTTTNNPKYASNRHRVYGKGKNTTASLAGNWWENIKGIITEQNKDSLVASEGNLVAVRSDASLNVFQEDNRNWLEKLVDELKWKKQEIVWDYEALKPKINEVMEQIKDDASNAVYTTTKFSEGFKNGVIRGIKNQIASITDLESWKELISAIPDLIQSAWKIAKLVNEHGTEALDYVGAEIKELLGEDFSEAIEAMKVQLEAIKDSSPDVKGDATGVMMIGFIFNNVSKGKKVGEVSKKVVSGVAKAQDVCDVVQKARGTLRKSLGLLPGDPRKAHHIVSIRNKKAQAILMKYGIEVNGKDNGVGLMAEYHTGPHSDEYDWKVLDALDKIDKSSIYTSTQKNQKILEELDKFRKGLLNGSITVK